MPIPAILLSTNRGRGVSPEREYLVPVNDIANQHLSYPGEADEDIIIAERFLYKRLGKYAEDENNSHQGEEQRIDDY